MLCKHCKATIDSRCKSCPECGGKIKKTHESLSKTGKWRYSIIVKSKPKIEILTLFIGFIIIESNPELEEPIDIGYKGLFDHSEGIWFIRASVIFLVAVGLLAAFLRIRLMSNVFEGTWDWWDDVLVIGPLCIYGVVFVLTAIYQLLAGAIFVPALVITGSVLLISLIYILIELKIKKEILG